MRDEAFTHKMISLLATALFTLTFYAPGAGCGNGLKCNPFTYSGYAPTIGWTVACDLKYYPLGTVFFIEGWGYRECEDIGGGVRGSRRLDIFVEDVERARHLGIQKRSVRVVRRGDLRRNIKPWRGR